MEHIVKKCAFLFCSGIHKPAGNISHDLGGRTAYNGRHRGYLHNAVITEDKLYSALLDILIILMQSLILCGGKLKLGLVDEKL